jgi:hypothetical protein
VEAVEREEVAEPVVVVTVVAATVVTLPGEWATAVAVTEAAAMVRAVLGLSARVTAWR